ncbi:MAG: DUF934 domain-containing protein [Pseudomonadota bacterium]
MPLLIKDRAVVADEWTTAEVFAPGAAKVILPLAEYIKAIAAGAPAASTAVLLKPEEHDLAPLLPYVAQLPLIAAYFGSTGEGRGYTQARLLRERHGYKGELRAMGKIRVDQVYLLARCGFDAFELLDGEDPVLAIAQLGRFSVAYQPGVDGLTHPRRRYGG